MNSMLMNYSGKTTQVLAISTSEMDDLRNAVDCLHTFAHTLEKDGFAQFVPQSAQALVPVFEFDMSEEIRAQAMETWAELCLACREAGNTQLVSELTMEFMKRNLPKFEEEEKDIEAFKTRADGMHSCLDGAGPGVLNAQMVKEISNAALKIFEASMKRRESESSNQFKGSLGDYEEELRQ